MTSSNWWVVSDWHFNHNNIIKYCNRPFSSTDEMNEVMIQRHNALVKFNDKVYFLGDAYFGRDGSAFNLLSRLNGKKRLILGNHDNIEDGVLTKLFERIYLWRVFRAEKMVFSHVPMKESQIRPECIQIHGHIHDQTIMKRHGNIEIPDPIYVNVCVEHTNYEPVAFEEVRDFKSKLKTPPKETDWGPSVGKEVL